MFLLGPTVHTELILLLTHLFQVCQLSDPLPFLNFFWLDNRNLKTETCYIHRVKDILCKSRSNVILFDWRVLFGSFYFHSNILGINPHTHTRAQNSHAHTDTAHPHTYMYLLCVCMCTSYTYFPEFYLV